MTGLTINSTVTSPTSVTYLFGGEDVTTCGLSFIAVPVPSCASLVSVSGTCASVAVDQLDTRGAPAGCDTTGLVKISAEDQPCNLVLTFSKPIVWGIGTLRLKGGGGKKTPSCSDCSGVISALDCYTPTCGDGHIDGMEECDDGNNVTGDGCSAQCKSEVACCGGDGLCSMVETALCGSPHPDVFECISPEPCCTSFVNKTQILADPVCCAAQGGAPGACPVCGNGVKEAGEECDDGNTEYADGCTPMCVAEYPCCFGEPTGLCAPTTLSTCTNQGGVPRPGDGACTNATSRQPCCYDGISQLCADSACCTELSRFSPGVCVRCGNGVVEFGEECDDGNHNGGDGCNATCGVEEHWSCVDGLSVPSINYDCFNVAPSVCAEDRGACCWWTFDAHDVPDSSECRNNMTATECAAMSGLARFNGKDSTCPSLQPDLRCCYNGQTIFGPAAIYADCCDVLLEGAVAKIGSETCAGLTGSCCRTCACDEGATVISTDCAITANDARCQAHAFNASCPPCDALPSVDGRVFTQNATCAPGACASISRCGDGVLNVLLGEECDDGNNTNGDGCSSNCKNEGRCCNLANDDSCTNTLEAGCYGSFNASVPCGNDLPCCQYFKTNTTVWPHYTQYHTDAQCCIARGLDNVAFGFGYTAVGATCPVCGDGAMELEEECDDGNDVDGDGCSAMCTIERGACCVTNQGYGCSPDVTAQVCTANLNGFFIGVGSVCSPMEDVRCCVNSTSVSDPALRDPQCCGVQFPGSTPTHGHLTCDGLAVCPEDTDENVGACCVDVPDSSHDLCTDCECSCALCRNAGHAWAGAGATCASLPCGCPPIGQASGACRYTAPRTGVDTCRECDCNICRAFPGAVFSLDDTCAECGNGILENGEACDDGNQNDGDGCSQACVIENACCSQCITSENIVADATCFNIPSHTTDCSGITNECKVGSHVITFTANTACVNLTCGYCGNGIVDSGEECDDDNTDNTDACTDTCKSASCGDGYVQAGEECDDGNSNNTDACTNACKNAVCGDGFVQAGEECDDGDGCTSQCKLVVLPSNGCCSYCQNEAGTTFSNAQCVDAGTSTSCGHLPAPVCSNVLIGVSRIVVPIVDANCTSPLCQQNSFCGDGVVNTELNEACDDGNNIDTDQCSNACSIELVCPYRVPDHRFSYSCTDVHTGCPFNPVDTGAGGTPVVLGDEDVMQVELPFNFSFFTNRYTSVNVSDNGCLGFSGGVAPFKSNPILNQATFDNMIAMWWIDFDPSHGGSLRTTTIGVAPTRVFIVDYDDVPYYTGGSIATERNTFQVKLFEDRSRIEVHYASMMTRASYNDQMTAVGITNPNGKDGLEVYYGAPFRVIERATCYAVPGYCGNGRVELGEECDDWNNVDTDGCSNTCVAKFMCNATTPDPFGYTCTDVPTGCLFDPVDVVAAGGIIITTPNSVLVPVALPFNFTFYGNTYTSVNVSDKGCLIFPDGHVSDGTTQIPTPGAMDNMIAAWWNSFDLQAGGAIWTVTIGVAPTRVFIVAYDDVPYYRSNERNTFQIKLFEDGSRIEVHYTSAMTRYDSNLQLTVGIENATGTGGYQVYYGFPFHVIDQTICYSPPTVCSNGVVEFGEECDDGNLADHDGCSSTCLTERCGDGILHVGEECDDGNTIDIDACTNACKNATCGDGIVRLGEECDDGNTADNDGCSSACVTEPFTCCHGCYDPSTNATVSGACGACGAITFCASPYVLFAKQVYGSCNFCTRHTCGDGNLDVGVSGISDEGCDDGNLVDGDGCSSTCQLEVCGNGIVQNDEECDDGNIYNTDDCTNACKHAVCGDGIRHVGVEVCDDGNTVDTDACTNACATGLVCSNTRADSFGYTCTDHQTDCSFDPVDVVSAGGTPHVIGSEDTVPVALPFNFTFYGNTYASVGVSSYGCLLFSPGILQYAGIGIPRVGYGDNLIATWWSGLDPSQPGSTIRTAVIGVAPTRVFVVDYDNVPYYLANGPNGERNTFQTKLFEGTSRIEMHYSSMMPHVETITTIGIENVDGTDGYQVYQHYTMHVINRTICFTPPAWCGNGIVDDGEQCDDGNTVNTDACTNACTNATCGDGVVRPGEECDDGNTVDLDGCSSACVVEVLTCCYGCYDPSTDATISGECGNQLCNSGTFCAAPYVPFANQIYDGSCNSCTRHTCGDGNRDVGVSGISDEECDDGNLVDHDGCSSTCLTEHCGDGIVQSGEECDDGNTENTDACTNACKNAVCGDGAVYLGVEECDDGNADNTDACTNACKDAACGDGYVQPGEECDDGNTTDLDGCSSTCQIERCGDGVVQSGEQCDDGNTENTDDCTNACKNATCGDGFVNAGEECDDGNTADNDGCSRTCLTERCGDGIVHSGEQCDDGNTDNTDACTNACTNATCGDGFVQAGEGCDDGNDANDDECTNMCKNPLCGNGIVQTGEECDDANDVNNDTCTNACKDAACGDGFIQVGEECDDGNTNNSDGCSSTCQIEYCGNGVVNPGEECDDGNSDNTDACTNACKYATCGDGFIQFVEGCDDGNINDGDGCSSTCQHEPITSCWFCDLGSGVISGECRTTGTYDPLPPSPCPGAGSPSTNESYAGCADCLGHICGDGNTDIGASAAGLPDEECDDGGYAGGCTDQCKLMGSCCISGTNGCTIKSLGTCSVDDVFVPHDQCYAMPDSIVCCNIDQGSIIPNVSPECCEAAGPTMTIIAAEDCAVKGGQCSSDMQDNIDCAVMYESDSPSPSNFMANGTRCGTKSPCCQDPGGLSVQYTNVDSQCCVFLGAQVGLCADLALKAGPTAMSNINHVTWIQIVMLVILLLVVLWAVWFTCSVKKTVRAMRRRIARNSAPKPNRGLDMNP